jgi:hypothetical protein
VNTINSEGGLNMQVINTKKILILVIAMFSMILMVGCAGLKKATPERTPGYLYYPAALVDADEPNAAKAGKDRECPGI